MKNAPQLASLQDRSLGPFTLQLQYQPRRRVGHFDLDLFLKDKKGRRSLDTLVTGIYSKGNPAGGISSWLDMHYLDRLTFEDGASAVLSKTDDLAEELFQMLGYIIPSGGMVICSYITDLAWNFTSPLHEVTRRCLQVRSLEIPPAATPIGKFLIAAGCLNIKAGAYDVQGSSRLAGEKALDGEYEKRFKQRLIKQLEEYLGREPKPEYKEIEDTCRTNAGEILDRMIMK